MQAGTKGEVEHMPLTIRLIVAFSLDLLEAHWSLFGYRATPNPRKSKTLVSIVSEFGINVERWVSRVATSVVASSTGYQFYQDLGV